MYDLIGFWTATTIHVTLMLALPLIIIGFSAILVISAAIEDAKDEKKFDQWLSDKFSGVEELLVALSVLSAVYWVLFGVVWIAMCGEAASWLAINLVAIVATVSTATAPFVGWIGYVITLLGGLFFVARYTYRALKFKEKVQDHLNDKEKHVSDKDIHN